jgi:hypothetical protein
VVRDGPFVALRGVRRLHAGHLPLSRSHRHAGDVFLPPGLGGAFGHVTAQRWAAPMRCGRAVAGGSAGRGAAECSRRGQARPPASVPISRQFFERVAGYLESEGPAVTYYVFVASKGPRYEGARQHLIRPIPATIAARTLAPRAETALVDSSSHHDPHHVGGDPTPFDESDHRVSFALAGVRLQG